MISPEQADVWTTPAKLAELTVRFNETGTPAVQRWLAPDLKGDKRLAGAFFDGTHVLVTVNGVALLLPKDATLPF